MEESSTSVVDDKHPAGWSPIGGSATKTLSFSMRVMAVNNYITTMMQYNVCLTKVKLPVVTKAIYVPVDNL